MTQKRLLASVLSVAVVAAICGLVFYASVYLPQRQQKTTEAYNQDFSSFKQKLYTGDPTSSLEGATLRIQQGYLSKEQEGSLKLLQASSLAARHQVGDVEQSIKIYKEVALNKYPALQQALALNAIAMTLIFEPTTSAQYQTYFPDEPFASYLPAAGSDKARVRGAYLRILMASEKAYPTSYADYAIANNYYVFTLWDSTGSSTQKDIARLIQQYVTIGDSKKNETVYSTLSTVPVWGNIYRALALDESTKVLKNKTLAEREDAYKLALNAAQAQARDTKQFVSPLALIASFYYAKFLKSEAYPQSQSQITLLLKPFAQVDASKVEVTYFTYLKSRSSDDPFKIAAIELAAISPEFKSFLLSVGFVNL